MNKEKEIKGRVQARWPFRILAGLLASAAVVITVGRVYCHLKDKPMNLSLWAYLSICVLMVECGLVAARGRGLILFTNWPFKNSIIEKESS